MNYVGPKFITFKNVEMNLQCWWSLWCRRVEKKELHSMQVNQTKPNQILPYHTKPNLTNLNQTIPIIQTTLNKSFSIQITSLSLLQARQCIHWLNIQLAFFDNSRSMHIWTHFTFLFNLIWCYRYAACLLSGMRPELVLNEDKKKKRFWKKIGKLFYLRGNCQNGLNPTCEF